MNRSRKKKNLKIEWNMDKAVRVTKMDIITRRFEQRKDKTVYMAMCEHC
jgi:hypothetical protein